VYVDLGLPVDDQHALTDIKSLLDSLDPFNHANPVFASPTALVMDSGFASSISSQGQMDAAVVDSLVKLGITEIDVLVAAGQTSPAIDTQQYGVTVNLIGADDSQELYDYLHNKHTPI
jgi:hypothetical protein